MTILRVLILGFFITVASAGSSPGALHEWLIADGGNGHFYEAVAVPNVIT